MAFLQVRNLTKSFGSTRVLDGVSFDLERGEVLSVIGSSGNGKTTLLRCLDFLEQPDGGTVTLDGELLYDGAVRCKRSEKQLRALRLHFGLVFQSFCLFPQYTALENVRLPLYLAEKERKKRGITVPETSAAERAEALLTQFGLQDKMRNYPCELSGGQCQRVAIARALALKPDILCFDEPTSALDPALTGEVSKIIEKLKTTRDITMIVVTHEMEFARTISDKVLFLSDGKALEYGDANAFFASPQTDAAARFIQNIV